MLVYTNVMLWRYPALRIHTWGGLGSQLFALALSHQLSKKYPLRRQLIVLHNGGVTKRIPEIYSLFPELKYIEINDFPRFEENPFKNSPNVLALPFRNFSRFIAKVSGFVAQENDSQTSTTKPWTLSVRGHYSHRAVSEGFLSILLERLEMNSQNDLATGSQQVVLHYRLGDLIDLPTKNFISSVRISKLLMSFSEFKEVGVFSDSPNIAVNLLSAQDSKIHFRECSLSAPDTILAATKSHIFVGTNSKISFWIAMLRVNNEPLRKSFLPFEFRTMIATLTGKNKGCEFY